MVSQSVGHAHLLSFFVFPEHSSRKSVPLTLFHSVPFLLPQLQVYLLHLLFLQFFTFHFRMPDMVTAGLAFDRPHTWATDQLKGWGAPPTCWFATSDLTWVLVQDRINMVLQHANGVHGVVYYSANKSSTSQYRIDFLDHDCVWSVVLQIFTVGPFHRTLPFIPSDACILLGACTPQVDQNTFLHRRLRIQNIVGQAGLSLLSIPPSP